MLLNIGRWKGRMKRKGCTYLLVENVEDSASDDAAHDEGRVDLAILQSLDKGLSLRQQLGQLCVLGGRGDFF